MIRLTRLLALVTMPRPSARRPVILGAVFRVAALLVSVPVWQLVGLM